ncbi:cytochrome P450 [Amycolatopsis sp. NPDC059027]|uniref:cytochrome P450 n=1 Tax=unclassified Amycolatopsis TaxID=2618356 RepID=UPI00366E8B4E
MADIPLHPATTASNWWNPFDPDFLASPYHYYSRLRGEAPLTWHEALNSWVVSSFDLCERVLRDWEVFAADDRRSGGSIPESTITVQRLDPPAHTRISKVLAGALRAQDFGRIATIVQSETRSRLVAMAADTSGDLVRDLAIPVSTAAMVALMGIPADLLPRTWSLSARIVTSMNAGLRPETREPGRRARAELSRLLDSCLDAKCGHGVLGAVASAGCPSSLPREVLVNSLRVVLLAGLNTAQRMLGLAALTLLGDEGATRRIRSSTPSNKVIHEIVRFDNPFQAQSRRCVASTVIAGVRLRRGDTVVALLGAANHDPARFPSPDALDFDRPFRPSLAFGTGTHACIGAAVAGTMLRAFLNAAWRDGAYLRRAGDPVFDANPTLRGLTRFPVQVR